MAQLDWRQCGEYRGRPKYYAKYDAYETPMGLAIAESTISPDVYFPDFYVHSTWVKDPFLEHVIGYGAGSCAHFQLSSGRSLEEVFELCEDYVYNQATSGLHEHNIRRLYEDAFSNIAVWYVEEQMGHEVSEVIYTDRLSAELVVLYGGYEPIRRKIVMNKDMVFSVYEG